MFVSLSPPIFILIPYSQLFSSNNFFTSLTTHPFKYISLEPLAMSNNMKTSPKKMRGFMCQSPAATAVCMTGDGRSVIVPRRTSRDIVENARLISNTKYSRLVESRRLGTAHAPNRRRPVFVPTDMVKREQQQDHHEEPKSILRKPAASLPTSDNHVFQVVVMRVSLHCQGCAGKVRKHLSKMEGVTSFSIDLENKRVTVMGHVSPTGVLESISKVKRAEFWPC